MAALYGPFYEELGRRVRELREKKRISQDDLGRRLAPPMTRASVANIEAGKQRILAHTLVELGRALDAQLAELVPAHNEAPLSPRSSEDTALEKELMDKLELAVDEVQALLRELAESHGGLP